MTLARARSKPTRSCHDRALGLLAGRMRSRRELRDRLVRAGFEADEIADELDRLEAVGLVDDERFAREVAEHQLGSRNAGARAIASALRAKGVSREVVERALAGVADEDEEGRALELARSRAPRLRGLAPERAYQRLWTFLVRRGYAPETSRHVARRALEEVAALE